MKWSELPQSAETDAAMRRAAAEKVMGWVKWPKIRKHQRRAWRDEQRNWMASASWNPVIRRDDLAQVFEAAFKSNDAEWKRTFMEQNMAGKAFNCWRHALTDPRMSLCRLLDLLQVAVPDGLDTAK